MIVDRTIRFVRIFAGPYREGALNDSGVVDDAIFSVFSGYLG